MLSITEILGTLAPVLSPTNIGTLGDISSSILIQPYRTSTKTSSSSKPKKKAKGKVGRPKGSKNKPYQEPESYTFQSVK